MRRGRGNLFVRKDAFFIKSLTISETFPAQSHNLTTSLQEEINSIPLSGKFVNFFLFLEYFSKGFL